MAETHTAHRTTALETKILKLLVDLLEQEGKFKGSFGCFLFAANFMLYVFILQAEIEVLRYMQVVLLLYHLMLLLSLAASLVWGQKGQGSKLIDLTALLLKSHSLLVLPFCIYYALSFVLGLFEDERAYFGIALFNFVVALLVGVLRVCFLHNYVAGNDDAASFTDIICLSGLIETAIDSIFLVLLKGELNLVNIQLYVISAKLLYLRALSTRLHIYDYRMNSAFKAYASARCTTILARQVAYLSQAEVSLSTTIAIFLTVLPGYWYFYRNYGRIDIFSSEGKHGFVPYMISVYEHLKATHDPGSIACENYYVSNFIRHRRECREAKCACRRIRHVHNNPLYLDMVVSLAERRMTREELSTTRVALFLAVLVRRDKSILPVNDLLLRYKEGLKDSFMDRFRIRYVENYMQKILDGKCSEVISVAKDSVYKENKEELVPSFYRKSLMTHLLFRYKQSYDQLKELIVAYMKDLRGFCLQSLYNRFEATELYETLGTMRSTHRAIHEVYAALEEMGHRGNLRHKLLYYIYNSSVNANAVEAKRVGREILEVSGEKERLAEEGFGFDNEHLFEKSVGIVASITAKEIGNISAVYGDTRDFFETGSQALIGRNAMELLPEVIARHHSEIMVGYPREVEKYVLHRRMESYLCSKSGATQALSAVFKYLPVYTIDRGILLCTYWKKKPEAHAYHLFVGGDNSIKSYSKGLCDMLEAGYLGLGESLGSVTKEAEELLGRSSEEIEAIEEGIVRGLSFCYRKFRLQQKLSSSDLTFTSHSEKKSVTINFDVEVELLYAITTPGCYDMNKVLLLRNPRVYRPDPFSGGEALFVLTSRKMIVPKYIQETSPAKHTNKHTLRDRHNCLNDRTSFISDIESEQMVRSKKSNRETPNYKLPQSTNNYTGDHIHGSQTMSASRTDTTSYANNPLLSLAKPNNKHHTYCWMVFGLSCIALIVLVDVAITKNSARSAYYSAQKTVFLVFDYIRSLSAVISLRLYHFSPTTRSTSYNNAQPPANDEGWYLSALDEATRKHISRLRSDYLRHNSGDKPSKQLSMTFALNSFVIKGQVLDDTRTIDYDQMVRSEPNGDTVDMPDQMLMIGYLHRIYRDVRNDSSAQLEAFRRANGIQPFVDAAEIFSALLALILLISFSMLRLRRVNRNLRGLNLVDASQLRSMVTTVDKIKQFMALHSELDDEYGSKVQQIEAATAATPEQECSGKMPEAERITGFSSVYLAFLRHFLGYLVLLILLVASYVAVSAARTALESSRIEARGKSLVNLYGYLVQTNLVQSARLAGLGDAEPADASDLRSEYKARYSPLELAQIAQTLSTLSESARLCTGPSRKARSEVSRKLVAEFCKASRFRFFNEASTFRILCYVSNELKQSHPDESNRVNGDARAANAAALLLFANVRSELAYYSITEELETAEASGKTGYFLLIKLTLVALVLALASRVSGAAAAREETSFFIYHLFGYKRIQKSTFLHIYFKGRLNQYKCSFK